MSFHRVDRDLHIYRYLTSYTAYYKRDVLKNSLVLDEIVRITPITHPVTVPACQEKNDMFLNIDFSTQSRYDHKLTPLVGSASGEKSVQAPTSG